MADEMGIGKVYVLCRSSDGLLDCSNSQLHLGKDSSVGERGQGGQGIFAIYKSCRCVSFLALSLCHLLWGLPSFSFFLFIF